MAVMPAYRGRFIPVDRTPGLPGAPRVRQSKPLAPEVAARVARREAAQSDDHRVSGVNAGLGSVWGSPVAPVTGRKARRQPGWRPDVAGGSHIIAQGV